jgi:hypothetical protein
MAAQKVTPPAHEPVASVRSNFDHQQPNTMKIATPNTNGKARFSLGDFLDREVLPGLSAEQVFTHPAHDWAEKNAGKWKGGCPWHESKSGTAFYLNPKTLLWRCSGCDGGGGPLQYLYSRKVGRIASPKGQAFIEAVRELAALAGVPFPEAEPDEESQKQAQCLRPAPAAAGATASVRGCSPATSPRPRCSGRSAGGAGRASAAATPASPFGSTPPRPRPWRRRPSSTVAAAADAAADAIASRIYRRCCRREAGAANDL